MNSMLRRLWSDDRGAVISTEMVLIIGILIFGVIPGLVALRNAIVSSLGTMGNVLSSITPSFTFSGFSIGGALGGGTIAQIQGYQLDGGSGNTLTGAQVDPIPLGAQVIIPPSP